jgi:hypothetical protein
MRADHRAKTTGDSTVEDKREHAQTLSRRSSPLRRIRRSCVPVVAKLEDRGLLSAIGGQVAAALHGPIRNAGPLIADVEPMTGQLARREAQVKARDALVIQFPGGSVKINRGGTHVSFPGGFVHANRHGTVVTFPGGYVIAGFGHTIVRFPGGFINI